MSLRQTAAEVQDEALREQARHSVDQLGRQVDTFDGKIRELIASDPGTDQRYRILLSIPGVGPVSAAALCCWMPELGQLGNRQAAALLGVAPFARDSGRRHGTRHIRGGRQRPRNVLYMAALSAAMHNPDLQRVCRRLKAAGKSHKVAIVAVMRKLIILANVLLRDARPWGRDRAGSPRMTALGLGKTCGASVKNRHLGRFTSHPPLDARHGCLCTRPSGSPNVPEQLSDTTGVFAPHSGSADACRHSRACRDNRHPSDRFLRAPTRVNILLNL